MRSVRDLRAIGVFAFGALFILPRERYRPTRICAIHQFRLMRQRTRKLTGAVALLALIFVWAMFAMSLAQGRVATLPNVMLVGVFITLGLIWVWPAAVIITWMSRPD